MRGKKTVFEVYNYWKQTEHNLIRCFNEWESISFRLLLFQQKSDALSRSLPQQMMRLRLEEENVAEISQLEAKIRRLLSEMTNIYNEMVGLEDASSQSRFQPHFEWLQDATTACSHDLWRYDDIFSNLMRYSLKVRS